jgi:NAD(P)-dependent dehydrogenase (short-subunit alcohol dehydrogenase family)
MRRLDGQAALVTGGSRGIGRAICQALDAEGARLIVHYGRNKDAAEATRASLTHGGASLAQADLASPDAISAMVAALECDGLDILVNNAGVWRPTPMGSTDEAVVDEVIDTNLKGLFWLTQAVLPRLRPGARIVNISSTAARVGVAGGRSLYGATKAAVDALTRNWALELAPRGIRVNAVAPGYLETDMTAEHFRDPAIRQRALSRHPLGRFTTADDVAKVVVFFCVDEGGFVTGQALNVSGGFVI